MAEQPSGTYRVIVSEANMTRLRQLEQRAVQLGMHDQFVEILSQVNSKLMHEPTAWGDPVNRLVHLSLTMYHRIDRFLSVRYAVDETRRIVYIKEWEPRPGHPLASE